MCNYIEIYFKEEDVKDLKLNKKSSIDFNNYLTIRNNLLFVYFHKLY